MYSIHSRRSATELSISDAYRPFILTGSIVLRAPLALLADAFFVHYAIIEQSLFLLFCLLFCAPESSHFGSFYNFHQKYTVLFINAIDPHSGHRRACLPMREKLCIYRRRRKKNISPSSVITAAH